ncbi:Protein-glutamate O-methyltransferase CheR [Sphingomonas antarctica]|uniref:CheR family methyltransferase n=1 Tax=Sphingomonas antarctica TaxID=2040274 RepID=UPI0039EC5966
MTDYGAAHRILGALIEARTGQQLLPSRAWRIDTSLRPLMRELDCTSLDALTARLYVGDFSLATRVVEALLNNETSFFRDREAFASIGRDVLPALAKTRPLKKLSIWSAGCSTGQEPYSLAMTTAEDEHFKDWDVSVVATDVSAEAISRGKAGRYSRFEIQRGLPIRQMLRWFREEGEEWHASAELRRRVRFLQHHLFDPPPGRFDLILCRNVLMYFSTIDRARGFDRMAAALAPGGLLVLGAGETVLGQTGHFRPHPMLKGCYMANEALSVAA